jgi:hypothetical protein
VRAFETPGPGREAQTLSIVEVDMPVGELIDVSLHYRHQLRER